MTLLLIEHYMVDVCYDEGGYPLDYPLFTRSRKEMWVKRNTIEECFQRCRKLNDWAKNCNWHFYEFADRNTRKKYERWLANEKRKEVS